MFEIKLGREGTRKRKVLRRFRRTAIVGADVTSRGRMFQSRDGLSWRPGSHGRGRW